MQIRRLRLIRLRWIALAIVVLIVFAACFAFPKLLGLWHSMQVMNAATEVASEIIGEPAMDWHTTDVGGAPVALADYRGQVVVLDFWYAGCGWCQRAMPQLIALAEEFKDQPVVVLGINTDVGEEETRRQHVIDTLGVTYPTLNDVRDGTRIHDLYKVTVWPTTVVLDQQGVVRQVHCGYWPWLKAELADKINELLAEDTP